MHIFNSKMSISRKFSLTFIFLIVCPIILLNVILSYTRLETQNADYMTTNRLEFSQIPQTLEEDLSFAFRFTELVYSDYDINTFLSTTFLDAKDFNDKYNDYGINKMLDFYASQSPNLSTPEIYTSNPTIVGETINIKKITTTVQEQSWYTDFIESNESVYLHIDNQTRYASILRKLDLNPTVPFESIVKITMDLDHVQNAINAIENDTTVYLLADKSLPLYSWSSGYNVKEPISYYSKLVSDNYGDDFSLVFTKNIDYYQSIRMVFVIERPSFFTLDLFLTISIPLIITLLASLIFMRMMKRNYIERIDNIVSNINVEEFIAQNSNKSKDSSILYKGNNELIMVEETMQNMSERIHSLIKEAYDLEMEKNQAEIRRKQSELNSLLSQINPHYLFNVLNAIRLKSLIKGEKETAKIILYVSKIFRQSITWNEDVIPLQEEISFIKEYLAIEKYRFEDKLSYVINMSEEANSCVIPKMSLQPFVENACVHGIQNLIDSGTISIDIEIVDDDFFKFKITNPVVQFSTEKLEQILGYSKGNFNVDTKSVGLKNTFARLRHYYKDFKFDILLNENYVTFELILPKNTNKDEE